MHYNETWDFAIGKALPICANINILLPPLMVVYTHDESFNNGFFLHEGGAQVWKMRIKHIPIENDLFEKTKWDFFDISTTVPRFKMPN